LIRNDDSSGPHRLKNFGSKLSTLEFAAKREKRMEESGENTCLLLKAYWKSMSYTLGKSVFKLGFPG
jgi:hypothetical protein